ncbi:L-threonylcarbamoyladenylate synthase [Marinicrinis lubricantis]|uniref:Threonylcarbamoyl-AMP synthase n=1 Tax=Marinicrinis lubricantis TaxID=2086470 RepID=A0ABW1IKA5_9BACL
MKTYLCQVDRVDPARSPCLREAASLLRSGGVVAFPTETVYGLGANAANDLAVERIFQAKGRPSDNPLIVHLSDASRISEWVDDAHPYVSRLAERFWPGPLTMVLPLKEGRISNKVTAGLSTLGIRIPEHPVARELISLAGCPIAAPSANRSGRPSPTLAAHVQEDLEGLIDAIVDGGPAGVGLESTVIELDEDRIHVLRPGGVNIEQLKDAIPEAYIISGTENISHTGEAPRAPGMKYTHYAPKGRMTVVLPKDLDKLDKADQAASYGAVVSYIRSELQRASEQGEKTGLLYFDEHTGDYHRCADVAISLGSLSMLETAAARLYDALRTFDQQGVKVIYAEGCAQEGVGLALMNRLQKAAGHQIVRR